MKLKVPIKFTEGFLLNLGEECENLKILKETNKDIIMNHDLFLNFTDRA